MTAINNLRRIAVLFVAIFAFSLPVFAQEGEPVVIDEVIAQVNDGVITLSRVKREIKAAAEALAQNSRKTQEEAQREMEARRPELIANLINEELLLQQGKEMGLENEVEAQVNARFDAIRKEQGVRTMEELYKQMRDNNLDPDEIKSVMRKQFMKEFVIRYGVGSKIYNGLTEKELRAYFEANKDKFKAPETVSLSEIFLSYAGRTEDAVKAEAAQIVKKVRAGADFTALVAQYSDRADSKAKKGSVGKFELNNLNEEVVAAIKNVKVGGVTEPMVQEDGVMILRVDERSVDTTKPVYNENRVREIITNERMPAETKKYIATLRQDAYIKIADGYKAEVTKALDKEQAKN